MGKQLTGAVVRDGAAITDTGSSLTYLRELIENKDRRDDVADLIATYPTWRSAAKDLGCSDSHLADLCRKHGIEVAEGEITAGDIEEGPSFDALRREIRRKQEKIDRFEEWTVTLRNIVEQTVAAMEPLGPPDLSSILDNPPDNDNHIAILNLSDAHFGEYVTKESTSGFAYFNKTVAQERKETLKRNFTKVMRGIMEGFPITGLIINVLGDWITGEDVYDGQAYNIDADMAEQAAIGGQALADIILHCSRMFPYTRVFCVPGNHKPKSTNFFADMMAYYITRERLRNQENIDFNMAQGAYLAYGIGDGTPGLDFSQNPDQLWIHALTHGHQAKRYMSIPYYGIDRLEKRLPGLLQNPIDHLFIAHHHEDMIGPGLRYSVNGSWPGGSDLSVNKMQAVSEPCQRVWLFHPRKGLTWTTPIKIGDIPQIDAHEGVFTPTEEDYPEVEDD